MKRYLTVFAAALLCAISLCIPVHASEGSVYLIDNADVISAANEATIIEKALEVSEKTGFNIVIFTEDDIGTPKTDAHVMEYADDRYEELCGINTDGILLLINCDTKYDWISTSGSCINYFSDVRIDSIFDGIYDDLKDENFAQAAYDFVFYVERYHDYGKANHQTEVLGMEFDADSFGATFFHLTIFALFVGVMIYAFMVKQYKMEKPSTRVYMLNNSLYFDNKSDVFVGNVTTRVYSPRSSSGGGGHGGGHHSSTHHSHSGGRHGGGGRHR